MDALSQEPITTSRVLVGTGTPCISPDLCGSSLTDFVELGHREAQLREIGAIVRPSVLCGRPLSLDDSMACMEEPLSGGNMNLVVQIGDTVRRPSGPWTPAVHDLLRHVRAAGFVGAPEPLGVDEEGREVLRYIEGQVAWPPPEGWSLIDDDGAMRSVAAQIAAYHAAVASFSFSDRVWSGVVDLEPREIVCHHDFAPWNLVVGDDLVFVDWDLAAPGPRLADLGYAARAFAPMFPGYEQAVVLRRLGIMCETWRVSPSELIGAAVDRAKRGHLDFARRVERGEDPWLQMWNDGHGEGNARILRFMEANERSWIDHLEGTSTDG